MVTKPLPLLGVAKVRGAATETLPLVEMLAFKVVVLDPFEFRYASGVVAPIAQLKVVVPEPLLIAMPWVLAAVPLTSARVTAAFVLFKLIDCAILSALLNVIAPVVVTKLPLNVVAPCTEIDVKGVVTPIESPNTTDC